MLKSVDKRLAAGLIMALLLAGCAPAAAPQEDRLTGLEARVDSLQAELDSLKGSLAEAPAESAAADSAGAEHASDPFAVSVAQVFMDTAGFHGMAENISTTQQVDPADLGTVNRVRTVLSSLEWPGPLADQGQAFETLLADFAAALEADDGPRAAELAEQVHDAQHEFSHAISEWLGTAGGHEE